MIGYSSLELCSGHQAGGKNTHSSVCCRTHTHKTFTLSRTLRGFSEVKLHLSVLMEEAAHLGIEPTTFKANPVLAASPRLHTEPDFNQPLCSDTAAFPLLPKQTFPGSEKALRQRCCSASTSSKDTRSDPPSSTAGRSPLRWHLSASIHKILPLQTFIYEVNLHMFPARRGVLRTQIPSLQRPH